MRIQIKRNVYINKLHDKREVQLVYIAIKLPVLVALLLSYSYVNSHNVSLIRQFFPTGTVIVAMSYTRFVSLLETATLDDTNTRVGTLIVTTIYLQLIQNRCMFRSFTVLQCSHQHCVQPVASDVEVVEYL